MKSLSICILLSFLCSIQNIYGQEICITNTKQNQLYIGIDNPLQVMIQNQNCESIQLVTDNGSIYKDSCVFFITPARIGRANISVMNVINNDTVFLEDFLFGVKGLPTPTAYFAGLHEGELPGIFFSAQKGIYAQIDGMDINIPIKIKEYTVVIINGQKSASVIDIKGNKITKELKEQFDELMSGDIVIFMNIYATMGSEKKKKLNSINFKIK